jgi:hypothetical protein
MYLVELDLSAFAPSQFMSQLTRGVFNNDEPWIVSFVLAPASETTLTSKIRSSNGQLGQIWRWTKSQTHLMGTKFLSSAVMTVLATPLLGVVGNLCTAFLAIGVGLIVLELEAIFDNLQIKCQL